MTEPMTDRERAAVMAAANGRRPPATRLPEALRSPAPVTSPTPAPATTPPPQAIEHLLARAARSEKARIRNLGDKIRGLVNELSALLAVDNRRQQAEARVDQARAALARAQKELQELTGRPAAAPPRTVERGESAKARAWALSEGVDVPRHGVVPARTIQAWREAGEPS